MNLIRSASTIEQLKNSQFILIRHAQSTYNFTWESQVECIEPLDSTRKQTELSVATNFELLDSPLSHHGVE